MPFDLKLLDLFWNQEVLSRSTSTPVKQLMPTLPISGQHQSERKMTLFLRSASIKKKNAHTKCDNAQEKPSISASTFARHTSRRRGPGSASNLADSCTTLMRCALKALMRDAFLPTDGLDKGLRERRRLPGGIR